MWTRRRVEPHLKLLDKLEEYLILPLTGLILCICDERRVHAIKEDTAYSAEIPRSIDSDHFTRYSSIVEKEGLDWKIIVQELNSVKLLY